MNRKRTGFAARLGCLLVFYLLAMTSGPASSWAFVSLDGEDRIVTYRRDSETGGLEEASSTKTSGSPGSLCFDAKRRVLFAAMRSSKQLASFKFGAKTGKLTQLSIIKVEPDPAYVSLDHTGRWLLSAYYVAGKVAVHPVDSAGLISPKGTWHATAEKAHAALTDPDNRWLLVPHTGPNAIYGFRFDPTAGTLASAKPEFIKIPPKTGPRHIVFHPRKPIAYSVNEQGGSVTSWNFDKNKGALEEPRTLSTLPEDFTAGNACADIELTPNANWLFASNRGHDSLACFRVDPGSGRLRLASITKTEATPRQFTITPDGKHLYAAGQSSGKIACFHIDNASGTLRRFATIPTGKRPWWILASEVPK